MGSSYANGGLDPNRFVVVRPDGTRNPEAEYFVLNVAQDPHARAAIEAYACSVSSENRKLGQQIRLGLFRLDNGQDFYDGVHGYLSRQDPGERTQTVCPAGEECAAAELLEFKECIMPERARTYMYPDGSGVTVYGVARVCARPSGFHRLETNDGEKFIIAPGWIALHIDADGWSF